MATGTGISVWISGFFVFLFSFPLNFVWEALHAVFLYAEHNFLALPYVKMVVYASSVDATLVTIIFLLGRYTFGKDRWLKQYGFKEMLFTVVLGIVFAVVIELKAVYVLKQWSYNELMPTIFGIGLSPLVQLAITGVVSIMLTSVLLNGYTKK